MNLYRRERGVALITMLLVFAVVATLTGEMVYSQMLAIRRSQSSFQERQAVEYALAGEVYARQILFQDYAKGIDNAEQVDSLNEEWSNTKLPFEPERGEIYLSIVDGESRFNVNNLVDESGNINEIQMKAFKRLLSLLSLDEFLAEAIVDWMDKDQQPLGQGTEDFSYLGKPVAYRSANRKIADISELQAIAGFGGGVLNRIRPFVVALPGATGINVNTASPTVLQAVIPGLDGEAFIEWRNKNEAIFSIESFMLENPFTAGLAAPEYPLVTTSHYFEVQVLASFAERQSGLFSRINRLPEDGNMLLISREFRNPVNFLVESSSLL